MNRFERAGLCEHRFHVAAMTLVEDVHEDLFAFRDCGHSFSEDLLDALQFVRPGSQVVWPGEPRCTVRLPLGRHTETEFGRRPIHGM